MYLLFGAAILVITLVAMRIPALARFDQEVPDAIADDLVGVQALRRTTTSTGSTASDKNDKRDKRDKTEALT
jgi:hypothetical protein